MHESVIGFGPSVKVASLIRMRGGVSIVVLPHNTWTSSRYH